MRGRQQRERAEARVLAQLAALHTWGSRLIHVPNESYGARRGIMAGQGVSPGMPDYLLFWPTGGTNEDGRPRCPGMALELKAPLPHDAAVTAAQREWLAYLAYCGWQTVVARGALEAYRLLCEYTGSRPRVD